MKLIFVNRYFRPDLSATSQLLSDLALHLARGGREVHVVTSRQRYEDAAARLPAEEVIEGVRVHRVWTSRFGRGTLPGRALDYLSFYLAAGLRLAALARTGDLVVAMTDPPLASLPAALAARLRGARLINWLQDVFPEIAQRLGLRVGGGVLGALARAARGYSLRAAALNIVLGDRMREVVERLEPGCRERIAVIHNWADGRAIRPLPAQASALRREWRCEGRFVVGYSGNFGRVHEFDTVVTAARALIAQGDVIFSFTGGGYNMERLAAQQLPNVLLHGYLPAERLADGLGSCDVHLVTLRPEVEGLVVPSKFYGIAAAGRPVIFVGDPRGEVAHMVRRADCGLVVAAGDAAGLARAIVSLRDDASVRTAMGIRARAMFEANYDRPQAMALWEAAFARAGR